MKFNMKSIVKWLREHKFISLVIILVVVGTGYFWYKSANTASGKVSYLTAPVEKGTLITSISGSGQVSASDQIDLKSKVSANVVYVGVKNGQQVLAGKLLMEFDPTDAQKAVRNAQISLDNAKLSLQKSESGNITIPQSKQQAQDNLAKSYNDGFNTVSDTFLDLPVVIGGLNNILFGNDFSRNGQQNISYYLDNINIYSNKAQQYRDSAFNSYQKAKADYDKNFDDYKLVSRISSTDAIESMITQTYATTQDISDAIKNTNNLIQFYQDTFTTQSLNISPISTTHLASLNTYTGLVDGHLSSLLNIKSTIQTDKNALINSDLDLQSQDLSIQQQQLSIQQAQNSLQDAKDNLADYYIYAPFAGIIASVALKNHDAVSSGTVAATLITNQSMTQIPFNEVDISKIKIGQKAILTFDAIENLSIVGQVADVDTLGTVTQGVVNYNVKILFDTQDSQVKPGMSITASVITNVKQDVLMVPNSAVKQLGNQAYVQVLVDGKPQNKNIEMGLANDTDSEVTSGLQEGDNVVTQTITATAQTSATANSSAIRIPGITGGGGGGFGGGAGATRTNTTGR